MRIAIVGTGYVGLVSGACFAEMGIDVTCVDTDRDKVGMLRRGTIPIYEPGLEELVNKNAKAGRLRFAVSLGDCLDAVEVVFCAVGTPPDEDGSADLSHVLDVARKVGRHMNRYVLFVTKSTVPVGTSRRVRETIAAELTRRGAEVPFDVASNPEFLKEGTAVDDFMGPDRIVIGVESERARKLMERIYKPFMLRSYKLIFTDISSAEMIKYAANAMLATRISFMNDIANLCDRVGADVNLVRKGIGTDSRIGDKFLYAGLGYGGSCFPKDIKALIHTAGEHGYDLQLLKAVEGVNDRQKRVLFDKLSHHFGGRLDGLTVALWGLAFKPETDDLREAPALVIIDLLLEAGCRVRAYDPVAGGEARRRYGDRIAVCDDRYEAAEGADALLLVTEWKEFRMPGWETLRRRMHRSVLFDGRNIYDPADAAEAGFIYYAVGRPGVVR